LPARIEETAAQSGLLPHDKALLVSHGVRDPLLLFNEAERIGRQTGLFDLIIVDTHQSHYCGDDFNDNSQMAAMAKAYQSMAEAMEGAVLILSHPNRAVASKAELVPAGGGAFLNQLDGNYTIERSGSEIELHWSEKLRSPDFEPVYLEQIKVTHKRVPWGQIKSPTVVCRPLEPAAMMKRRSDEAVADLQILRAIAACVKARTTTNIAEELAHAGGSVMSARQLGINLARMGKAGAISKSGKGSAIEWQLEQSGEARIKLMNGGVNGHSVQ
jgi:hypothetical protein